MIGSLNESIDVLSAVVRLGDADRLGWWRSHSVDDIAEYVLGSSFPSTWMATGVELAMESARVRHAQLLGRSTAVHLFSDYLPFHRLLRDWLIERKLEVDPAPLQWLRSASVEDLRSELPPPISGERRGDGLYLGEMSRSSLGDKSAADAICEKLTGALAGLDAAFIAPYVDLVD